LRFNYKVFRNFKIYFNYINERRKGFHSTYLFFSNIYYFLFERKVIYWLYNKEQLDSKIINTLDEEGGIVINILYLLVFSYIMYKLFTRTQA